MCIYCITPLAKGLCDTPLVLLTLKFHDLHPFLIYTPTPSVYAHPIFYCVAYEKLYHTKSYLSRIVDNVLAKLSAHAGCTVKIGVLQ